MGIRNSAHHCPHLQELLKGNWTLNGSDTRKIPTDFTKWFHTSHFILSSNSLNCLTSSFHLYCIATLGQSYNKNDEKDVHISEEPFTKKGLVKVEVTKNMIIQCKSKYQIPNCGKHSNTGLLIVWYSEAIYLKWGLTNGQFWAIWNKTLFNSCERLLLQTF